MQVQQDELEIQSAEEQSLIEKIIQHLLESKN